MSAMRDWTAGELDTIGAAEELGIAPLAAGWLTRPYATIWVVRIGGDLYVRSWRGRDGAWFRAALQRPEGGIRSAGIERDVTFAEPDHADHDAIDRAYRGKYARHASTYVDPMISPGGKAATLRLTPADSQETE
jgi:hypothetical protein